MCLLVFLKSCALLAILAARAMCFKFHCQTTECYVSNLIPEVEGTYVLAYIPRTIKQLTFENLHMDSVGPYVLYKVPATVQTLTIISSPAMKHLQIPSNLSVSEMHITRTGMNSIHFEENISLNTVIISSCVLEQLPLTLGNLKNLSFFRISNSQIQVLYIQQLRLAKNVEKLMLVRSRIHSIITDSPERCCDRLDELDLQKNMLTSIDFATFAPLHRLRMLILVDNSIEMLVGSPSNSALEYLALTNNHIKHIAFCGWNPLPNLISVNLRNNRLAKEPSCLENLSINTTVYVTLYGGTMEKFVELKNRSQSKLRFCLTFFPCE
ncbi:platelet glycoprotein V-like [Anopheles merus]|uniref:platelet glycoprotein V-like n=1 Tax=Anopheles merus TaxID=30066 RepID=UPI001BE49F75|nr:platelet glycoprotein V-like [Anopheles merus]